MLLKDALKTTADQTERATIGSLRVSPIRGLRSLELDAVRVDSHGLETITGFPHCGIMLVRRVVVGGTVRYECFDQRHEPLLARAVPRLSGDSLSYSGEGIEDLNLESIRFIPSPSPTVSIVLEGETVGGVLEHEVGSVTSWVRRFLAHVGCLCDPASIRVAFPSATDRWVTTAAGNRFRLRFTDRAQLRLAFSSDQLVTDDVDADDAANIVLRGVLPERREAVTHVLACPSHASVRLASVLPSDGLIVADANIDPSSLGGVIRTGQEILIMLSQKQ